MKSARLLIGAALALMTQDSAIGRECADIIGSPYRLVIEAENLRVGGFLTITIEQQPLAISCSIAFLNLAASTTGGEFFDVTVPFFREDSSTPCTGLTWRYVLHAPRNAGVYRVRLFFTDASFPNDPFATFLFCEQTIEVLPPLPIPTLHPAVQGLMALSMLGIGFAFARRMPT